MQFYTWCTESYLILEASKTKEMVIHFREISPLEPKNVAYMGMILNSRRVA